MTQNDERFIRMAISIAGQAREHGNHPFAAVLVSAEGELLHTSENSAETEDPTGHAEINLLRTAGQKFSYEVRRGCTLYVNSEPCVMCAAAIVWSNIRRVGYGLGMDAAYAMIREQVGDISDVPGLDLPSRTVFENAPYPIEVIGPALEDEARSVFEGFWQSAIISYTS